MAKRSSTSTAAPRRARANKAADAPVVMQYHVIEAVTPMVDCGRFPAKRVVGEPCIVEADIFRDGDHVLHAVVKWRRAREAEFHESPMAQVDNDRWRGEFPLDENGRYFFTIEAWTDLFASWERNFRKKAQAGRNVASDLLEGIAFVEAAAKSAQAADGHDLEDTIVRLRSLPEPREALPIVSEERFIAMMARYGPRFSATEFKPLLEITADRPLARTGAWYEIFPRSQGSVPGQAATLREAEHRLPHIRDLGFDVVYLTPIHPIGHTHRKGPNNSLTPLPDSPGSPWAIGSEAGGHDAVEPALGTLDDFDHFVTAANRLGLEVALDFAIQCSPDHPWVREHPEWFRHRPDGSIKYAENPPKEYQDIYPLDFETSAVRELMEAIRDVVLFWISHGVRIFRVDNPHTKPVEFWRWLIGTVQERHPDVIFLAEAFTRPKMMMALAKSGFTQSYTYFTWRNTKPEFVEYLTELTHPPVSDFFRPNFFTNTPDILSPVLQHYGRPAFKMRLVLAATLSPSYGMYSGYELCENQAVPGTEDYLNSEKYEIRTRDWNAPGNLNEFIARINSIRRQNASLKMFTNLQFLETDSDQILCYAKSTPDRSNAILVAVNLDPGTPHYCTVTVPPETIGVAPGQSYGVTDLLTGSSWTWGERNYVRLDPAVEPAHILLVTKSA
ncbi:MAG TPA: alpha-1,4-glucan--maltose-1-phosphate maltosyltransferase [Nitrospira sp.]|jgi:starch synthase (maltosyl-transferring)|nr:alpha-1,4-glucan--maltose-1-phosphate maltosyltransferase [Nitrospira sp.]